jgi:hypothetical protein
MIVIMKKTLILATVAVILSFALPSLTFGQGGVVGGGGGTGVLIGGQIKLLDLYAFDPGFKEWQDKSVQKTLILDPLRPRVHGFSVLVIFSEKREGYKLVTVAIDKEDRERKGKSFLKFVEGGPMRFAEDTLSMFLKIPRAKIHDILVNKIEWVFTEEEAPTQYLFSTGDLDHKVEVQSLAYYSHFVSPGKKFAESVISLPRWNKLGFLSQAGLIIHEFLRHYSISEELSPLFNLSELHLQRTTALITLCGPRPKLATYVRALLDANLHKSSKASKAYPKMKKSCLRRDIQVHGKRSILSW